MTCGATALTIDLGRCSPPEGATLDTLLGQIFVFVKQQQQQLQQQQQQQQQSLSGGHQGWSQTACHNCGSVKEKFRKYKTLTQRRIDYLELQLAAAKDKKLSSQSSQKKADAGGVEVLAEDSTLFDTPEKRPPVTDEVPETQLSPQATADTTTTVTTTTTTTSSSSSSSFSSSSSVQSIPLVLKYEHPVRSTTSRNSSCSGSILSAKRTPVKKKLQPILKQQQHQQQQQQQQQQHLPEKVDSRVLRVRREPSWTKTETESEQQQQDSKREKSSASDEKTVPTRVYEKMSFHAESGLGAVKSASARRHTVDTSAVEAVATANLGVVVDRGPDYIGDDGDDAHANNDGPIQGTSECVECQRFFENLDPELARVVKRCSKHRHKPPQAVVPSEMWRTKMQDTPELRAAGICNDTLPCDLNVKNYPKKRLL